MAARSAGVAALCVALALLLRLPSRRLAMETTQRLTGVVVDENGAPYWNATVIIRASPELFGADPEDD